jgi:hypothetical protein
VRHGEILARTGALLNDPIRWQDSAMTTERLEVERTIAADPATIFRVLSDPQGHVAIE